MRLKYQNFEDLVKQNKQELMDDDKKIKQIEYRLDEKVMNQHAEAEEHSTFHSS
ncbi:FbpB family small basic protein [Lentibacillus lipolyticus]|nr:FbpB family small basic protein [Lentibacillus lipolyticus]